MSHRFAVVAEATADHRTATELADRVLIDVVRGFKQGHFRGLR
jgi:hypothetical protein